MRSVIDAVNAIKSELDTILAIVNTESRTEYVSVSTLKNAVEEVNHAYNTVLNRDADLKGAMYYTEQLITHQMNYDDLLDALYKSDEYNCKAEAQHDSDSTQQQPKQAVGMLLADYDMSKGLARWSPLLFFSDGWTDTDRRACIDRLKAAGCNSIEIYAYNVNDFKHVAGCRVWYDESKSAWWGSWFAECKAAGLNVTVWLHADDRGYDTSPQAVMQRNELFIRTCGDVYGIKRYVLGLEAREYLSTSDITLVGNHLRTITSAQLCHHTRPNQVDNCNDEWVDYIYAQTKFFQPVDDAVNYFKQVASMFPHKKVIAAEYSLDSESLTARKIGAECLRSGMHGALCGAGDGGGVDPVERKDINVYGEYTTRATDGKIIRTTGPVASEIKVWNEKINLKKIIFNGGKIYFELDKLEEFGEVDIGNNSVKNMSVGNLWLVDPHGSATTIDYIRPNQREKAVSALYNADYELHPGTYYIFVSTLARNAFRSAESCRSNLIAFEIK